jgi:hypothetical protein
MVLAGRFFCLAYIVCYDVSLQALFNMSQGVVLAYSSDGVPA